MSLTRISSSRSEPATVASPTWGFLTNYALVLVYVVMHPESTVRQIAAGINITERATLAILRDLDEDEIVDRHRTGRRNTYSVNFARLSSVRRGGTTTALTPRPFVEAVIRMLFDLAKTSDATTEHPPRAPRKVASSDLQERRGTWGFFTNHMLILLAIARDHGRTVRELASEAEITERAAVTVLNQLEDDGIITRQREGRRNSYTIDFTAFRNHRCWSFDDWRVPAVLIDAAANGIRAMSAQHAR